MNNLHIYIDNRSLGILYWAKNTQTHTEWARKAPHGELEGVRRRVNNELQMDTWSGQKEHGPNKSFICHGTLTPK